MSFVIGLLEGKHDKLCISCFKNLLMEEFLFLFTLRHHHLSPLFCISCHQKISIFLNCIIQWKGITQLCCCSPRDSSFLFSTYQFAHGNEELRPSHLLTKNKSEVWTLWILLLGINPKIEYLGLHIYYILDDYT